MPLYAKSAEGQRSYFWYNKKEQPTTMSIEADKNSAAVTVGRVYYIRQQRSGKYIDTQEGDKTYSNIQQYTFNGSDDQKWKVEDAGEGYIKLVSQSGTKSKLLDVLNGWSADGTNIQLYPDHGHDAQKFKLKAVEGGGYQLLAKCSNDEKCVMVLTVSQEVSGTLSRQMRVMSVWHHRMEYSFVYVHVIPVSMYAQQMAL